MHPHQQTFRSSQRPSIDVEAIEREVRDKFGYFPQFFAPALRDPPLLDVLWQDVRVKYIENRLPILFKEMLFTYLSKECGNRYCVVAHSIRLRGLGMTAQQIKQLLIGMEKLHVDQEIKDLLRLSLDFYKKPEEVERLVPSLKLILGMHYDDWVSFMSFIVMTHRWVEGHGDEISYVNDESLTTGLDELVSEAKELEEFLKLRPNLQEAKSVLMGTSVDQNSVL